jgi:hypothetical protein
MSSITPPFKGVNLHSSPRLETRDILTAVLVVPSIQGIGSPLFNGPILHKKSVGEHSLAPFAHPALPVAKRILLLSP